MATTAGPQIKVIYYNVDEKESVWARNIVYAEFAYSHFCMVYFGLFFQEIWIPLPI